MRIITIILSLICVSSATAQTDSLLNELNKSKEDTNKVNLLWDVGASLAYQNPPQAIPYFKQSAALAKKLNYNRGAEKGYTGISFCYANTGKFDSALIFIDTAVIYSVKVGSPDRMALVYLNRADAYANLGNYAAALKDCETAVGYAHEADNKDRQGRIYGIMSDIYRRQNQLELSLEYQKKELALFTEIQDYQMVGHSLLTQAQLLSKMGKGKEATVSIQRSIVIADSINNTTNLSYYYHFLAGLEAQDKQYEKSIKTLRTALEYAEKSGHIGQRYTVIGEMAATYALKGKNSEAISYAEESYNWFKDNNHLERSAKMAKLLAELYHKTGNINNAYRFLEISTKLNDSLLTQQYNSETAQLQTALDVAEKERDIQLLSKEKESQQQKLIKQQYLFYGSIVFIILLLAGVALLINRNRLRHRMKELELRNKIAADLHDEVGSSLSSINMLSEMAKTGPENTKASILEKVSEFTKETMDKMSDIVWMIKPVKEDNQSLKERMEKFLHDISLSKQISTQLIGNHFSTLRLNMEEKKALYLIFKEAVNNAAKYADATQIIATVKEENGKTVLQVTDNGKGFDINNTPKGNGLHNMESRAAALGGTTTIESVSGKGTTICFTI